MSSNFLCSFPGCSHSFLNYERFLLHLRRHVNFDIRGNTHFESVLANYNGNHCCTQCEFVTESAFLFSEHLRQHIFDSPYICDLCDVGVKTIHDIKLHFKSNHTGSQLKFKVSDNENVLKLIMDTIQRDNNNVYFMMGAEKYAVCMKADTSFWFIISFASPDKMKIDKICLSKNMSNIVNRDVLERFPKGCIVSDKTSCISNELKSSIEKKSSSLLNAHDEHSQIPRKDIGSYKFTGSEFHCLSCHFVTKSRYTFSDHIWKDVHGSESSCFHRKVESCVLDGKRICALVESTLYCLVFILNAKEKNMTLDQKCEHKCFKEVKTDDLNYPDRGDKGGKDLVRENGQCPVSFSATVNQHDLSFRTNIDEQRSNEAADKKQSFDSGSDKHVVKSNSGIEMDAEETSMNEMHLPKEQRNQFDFKSSRKVGGNHPERIQNEQLSMFPFSRYLKECSTKKEHFELVHDTASFPFVCESCKYSCVSKKLFDFHKYSCLKPSDSSDYSCPRCLGNCGSLTSLLKHVSFHLGSTVLSLYICCYCGKYFTNLDFILSHLAKRHSGEYSMNNNAVKIIRKTIGFLQNVFKCFVCGSGHCWPSEYVSHLKNSHKMFSLARYFTKEFPEHDFEGRTPTITFPKCLLSCDDGDAPSDKSSNDLSFETEAALDLIEDRNDYVDCNESPMDQ